MIIYKITNKINGKIYIGQTAKTLEERWERHLALVTVKVNRYLYDAMNHYGADNFSIEKIEDCKDKKELNERERFWIKTYDSMNKNKGYNMQEGGIGGKQPDEVIERSKPKISAKSKGHSVSQEVRLHLSLIHMGDQNPAKRLEVRRKISHTLKGKYERGEIKATIPNLKGEQHPMYGKTHTEEAKKRMSLFRKGKTYEEVMGEEKAKEVKRKKSEDMMGNKRWKRKEKSDGA